MKERINFLTNSINDIQGTIRAIDTKFFGIFVILLLPITELDEISKAFKGLYSIKPTLTTIILTVIILSWTLSIIICLLGIYSISNPIKRIKNIEIYDGKNLFYRAGLYKVNFFNQFYPKIIKSDKSLENMIKEMNVKEQEIINELVLEQAKLVYIRDLKIARQRFSLILLILSIILITIVLILNSIL